MHDVSVHGLRSGCHVYFAQKSRAENEIYALSRLFVCGFLFFFHHTVLDRRTADADVLHEQRRHYDVKLVTCDSDLYHSVSINISVVLSDDVYLKTYFFAISSYRTSDRASDLWYIGIRADDHSSADCAVLQKTAKSIARFLIKILAKIRIIKDKEKALENLDHQIDNYIQSAIFLKSNTKMLFQLYAILILQFAAYFSIPYFVYLAFGQHGYHWSDFVAMQSMVQLSAGSLPLPGAVGASENSFVKLFQYVYPSNLIMPGLLLSRGINFYLYLIVSGVSVFFVHLRVDRLPKKKSQNTLN